MDDREVKLRCIEAASRAPVAHDGGPVAGVLVAASAWFDWIISERKAAGGRDTLHLPGKDKK